MPTGSGQKLPVTRHHGQETTYLTIFSSRWQGSRSGVSPDLTLRRLRKCIPRVNITRSPSSRGLCRGICPMQNSVSWKQTSNEFKERCRRTRIHCCGYKAGLVQSWKKLPIYMEELRHLARLVQSSMPWRKKT